MTDIRPDLASFARVSYLRELTGDVPGAVQAMGQAAEAGSTRAENVAWTQAQLGNLAFNAGDLAGAKAKYDASLYTVDDYVYGIAGLGRVAAAEGDFATAIQHYRDAIQRMPLPEFVIALGEVYEAAGQPSEAAAQYELVQAMIRLYAENGVDTDVELALFLADHGSDPAAAVEKARAGFEKRPSIKGADVLAWALYQAGNYDEARIYSQQALHLGTRDATMLYHAGMIAAALGDDATATDLLTQALSINPAFSPLYAPLARTTLDGLISA
jgi:tetratricopeptide (TPR) repeat protein